MTRSKAQTAHLMASPDDVEAQFYEALREADIARLMALWADDDDAVCVHPGGQRLVGPQAIRAAFEAVFAKGGIAVRAERVRRLQTMDTAVHHVVERVDIATEQGARVGYVLATNVYLKTALGWRMVTHHASPGAPESIADTAEAPSVLH